MLRGMRGVTLWRAGAALALLVFSACSLLVPLDDHATSLDGGGSVDASIDHEAQLDGGASDVPATDASPTDDRCRWADATYCLDFDEPDAYPGWGPSASGLSVVGTTTDASKSPPAALRAQARSTGNPFAAIRRTLPADGSKHRIVLDFDVFVRSGCVLGGRDVAWLIALDTGAGLYGPALVGKDAGPPGLGVVHLPPGGSFTPGYSSSPVIGTDQWVHVRADACANGGSEWDQSRAVGGAPYIPCTYDASVPSVVISAGLTAAYQKLPVDCEALIDNLVVSTE
jgi:hypothetical protein